VDLIDSAQKVVGYPAIFRDYILRTAERNLAQLEVNHSAPLPLLEQALHILTFVLNVDDAWPLARQLLLVMAPRMEQAGYRDDWIPFVDTAIARSQTLRDPLAEAQLSLHLGYLHQLRGRYEVSIAYLQASADRYAGLGHPQLQAEALSRWAYVARLQRNYAEAERLVTAACQLLSPQDIQLAFCDFVRGAIANDQRDWTGAIAYVRASLAAYQRVGDQRMIALRLGNLGSPLFMNQQYPEAIACYEQAIALFAELPDPVQQAVMQMNLGNVYSVLEQPEQALALYAAALPILRRVRDELHLAMLDTNRGIAHRQCQHWSDAETLFLAAIERWRQLGNARSQANAYDELGVTYLTQGQVSMAKGAFLCAYNLLIVNASAPSHAALLETVKGHLAEVGMSVN
jgi:tetratricopeptide (TPR) repeat protein